MTERVIKPTHNARCARPSFCFYFNTKLFTGLMFNKRCSRRFKIRVLREMIRVPNIIGDSRACSGPGRSTVIGALWPRLGSLPPHRVGSGRAGRGSGIRSCLAPCSRAVFYARQKAWQVLKAQSPVPSPTPAAAGRVRVAAAASQGSEGAARPRRGPRFGGTAARAVRELLA